MEAIGLNPIRLDAIGIDPIRLNAIKLGVPGASSGSDRPYIAPEVLASLVAVVKCDGKSNNDPDRAIIKNLVDPDNPFVISNAAYKLNSGFGKYEADYSTWTKVTGVTSTPFGFKITEAISSNYWLVFLYNTTVPAHKVKVSGIPEGGELRYSSISVTLENGINELPEMEATSARGFTINLGTTQFSDWIGLSVEQIPSFQGSFYADGVNDMITSTKTMSEMLGGGNKCTVISFITHISGAGKYNVIGNNRIQVSDYSGQSFMAGCSSKSGEKIVELGDKEKIQAFQYTTFDSKLSIGSLESGLEISSYAYYGTFVFNKDSVPIDWIHQVIAYFYLDKYVTPDIIYDTIRQGITNENHASFNDELVDFSGNGHNLKIYNSAWNKESGINDEGAWQTDAVEDYGQFVGDLGLKDYTVAVDRAYVEAKSSQVPIISNAINLSDSTPFIMEYLSREMKVASNSFGVYTTLSELNINRFISYQNTYKYGSTNITRGTSTDTGSGLTIGRKLGSSVNYCNIALWSLLLFPYTLSEFLLERQLKRYKLGTLYPDMVEFRPIIKSNVPYDKIVFHNSSNIELQVGNYYTIGSQITIYIRLSSNPSDEIKEITLNGIPAFFVAVSSDNVYQYRANLNSKSPQKINITIDEYIRYEDIVQPYPCIVPIIDTNGKTYSWGDKIKVGTEIQGGIIGIAQANLLPDLYKVTGYFNFNGVSFAGGVKHVICKTNVFELTNAPTYLKANEPNCIADPQRLRIPNSSYKILGYIPDISGHGNHLKINNSAYAGMSGANGYMADFTNWQHTGVEGKATDSKFEAIGIASTRWILYKGEGYNFPTTTYIVTGIPKDVSLTYNNDTTALQIENGVPFTIASYSASSSTGFVLSKGVGADLTGLIIEQIGEYEGSFCLDGVDDFITIPTLSHGAKQVLMKVNWSNFKSTLYDQRIIRDSQFFIYTSDETENVIAYKLSNNGETYIDGILNTAIMTNQLKGITHNITITNNNVSMVQTKSPNIGKTSLSNANFAQMALFAFMSFDDISSEEEIKELNDIVGIEGGYVESPDYYWDAYGKSNMAALDIDYQDLFQSGNSHKMLIDKSKAGLAALELYHNSGNNSELINRRLNLNNFAFNEESGYGGWLGIGDLTNALNYRGNSTTNNWKRGGTFLKDIDRNNKTGCGYAYAAWFDSTNHILKFKIKITGLTDADELYICQYNIIDPEIKQQLFNGINEVTLDLSASIEPTYQYISFRYPPLTNNVDFEFLYEYQNGLVSDGVNDNLKNTNMPVLTDYTWIMKRKRLNDNISTLCHKGDGVNNAAFLFEYIEGGQYTRSFSASGTLVKFPDLISYQTKNSYNGKNLILGNQVDGNQLRIFMGSDFYPRYTKAVFYKAMLYSKTIDQLSINMLKNLFAKDELIDVNNPIFKQNN